MGRPRKHTTPYTGDQQKLEAAFNEYLSCIVDCFGKPYDDRDYDAADASGQRGQRNFTSLRAVCEEFSISIPKARKLLITAGVYSTEKSRMIAALSAQGKSVEEIAMLTGLSRSSVSSYLPYQTFSYNMDDCSRHAEDSRKYRERKKTVEKLQEKIKDEKKIAAGEQYNAEIDTAELDKALWQCVIAFQNYPFYTTSGLSFSYTVRRKKNGEYSGELEISRKEESKILTRSSVLLAFHKVMEGIRVAECMDPDDTSSTVLIPVEYKGPKSIGQIFGISYVYSLFWRWGLIQVPEKVENKLRGKGK